MDLIALITTQGISWQLRLGLFARFGKVLEKKVYAFRQTVYRYLHKYIELTLHRHKARKTFFNRRNKIQGRFVIVRRNSPVFMVCWKNLITVQSIAWLDLLFINIFCKFFSLALKLQEDIRYKFIVHVSKLHILALDISCMSWTWRQCIELSYKTSNWIYNSRYINLNYFVIIFLFNHGRTVDKIFIQVWRDSVYL